MRVIVYSEVVGYIWVEYDSRTGLILDELGTRPDLETPENITLIQMQLEGEQ